MAQRVSHTVGERRFAVLALERIVPDAKGLSEQCTKNAPKGESSSERRSAALWWFQSIPVGPYASGKAQEAVNG